MPEGLTAGILAFGVGACLLSFVLVGAALALARRLGIYAVPGARQSHTAVTATGGGLGIIVALAVSSWLAPHATVPIWPIYIVPAALLLSILGWIDDRKTVSPMLRFFVQLAVSLGLLVFLRLDGPGIAWAIVALGGIVMTWVMNMYNFMDGSHGMAGFEGVFAAGIIAALSASEGHAGLAAAAMLTAACCLGFLPWNFPRPRTFMGDAGSVPLGFVLGGLLLLALQQDVVSLPAAVLVLSVFLIDSGWTLVIRVIRGERWYTPHKQHVYQRLIAHGWPHGRVLLLYQAINFGVVLPALVLAIMYPEHAWPIAAVVGLLLSAGWHAASLRLEVRA